MKTVEIMQNLLNAGNKSELKAVRLIAAMTLVITLAFLVAAIVINNVWFWAFVLVPMAIGYAIDIYDSSISRWWGVQKRLYKLIFTGRA